NISHPFDNRSVSRAQTTSRSHQRSRAREIQMPIRRAPRLTEAEVTDEAIYLNRRAFLAAAAAGAATLALGGSQGSAGAGTVPSAPGPLPAPRNPRWSTTEPTNRFDEATTYNNFYEFGVDKDDPARLGHLLGFGGLDWPYAEGLRLDEALHTLTLLTFGMYGQALPNQNGAPIRVVVPWKYGFKSAKSIVRITLVRERPKTAWTTAAPQEYGFYANVNPSVDHPRWSQATERRLGEFRRRKTAPFNGFADEVAALYTGMDLRRDY